MQNNTTILCIDDEEQICFALEALFRLQKWNVVTARSVEKGLLAFREFQPDIVLIDYHMPGINGVEGVKKFVLDTVRQAGPNPCPPIVLGIGVGGSFDKVAYLAKHALLRPIDQPNADPYYAQLEGELLEEINAMGIGPQGFGGQTTCLGLSIEAAPTHVAGLPVAVNVSCHVTRRATAQL